MGLHSSTSRQTPNKTHRFTLIEILVVLAIITLLTAILFPVFCAGYPLDVRFDAGR